MLFLVFCGFITNEIFIKGKKEKKKRPIERIKKIFSLAKQMV